jgi:hypothetical protein
MRNWIFDLLEYRPIKRVGIPIHFPCEALLNPFHELRVIVFWTSCD